MLAYLGGGGGGLASAGLLAKISEVGVRIACCELRRLVLAARGRGLGGGGRCKTNNINDSKNGT